MTLGILALQGAVEPHKRALDKLGIATREVRVASDLEGLSGIILPGGESTTLLHLLKVNKLWDALDLFLTKMPSFGVCAGAILLAKKVSGPEQASFAKIDLAVRRNAFGRQRESFEAPVTLLDKEVIQGLEFPGIFIRAPRFAEISPGVRILATFQDEPVMAQQNHTLVASFHPELTDDTRFHHYFVQLCTRHHAHQNT